MSAIIKIKSVDVFDEEGNLVEIKPEIPFSNFPVGAREAKPDPEDEGRLAWFVTLPD